MNIDRSMLENLIRAFRGIQALPPDDLKSFFHLGGLHGMPFRGPGVKNPDWWGGYCWHASALFPTWHRIYILTVEDALRSVPGCQDVTLPFWDETLHEELPFETQIPSVLTSETFGPLDGRTDNPLYSYKLAKGILDDEVEKERWRKPAGYYTVRYPLSGLVGTDADIKATLEHNANFQDPFRNTEILNRNVAQWMWGTVEIPNDSENTPRPDTHSVFAKFLRCLTAPNYTVFSNTASQDHWNKVNRHDLSKIHPVVALESPHNAVHLAVGGYYEEGPKSNPAAFNADHIRGANGDMGNNDTAAFDPIFFFHHCFIDYTFWHWQRLHGLTKRGDLTLIPGFPGTILTLQGQPPKYPIGTTLTMDTELHPFKKPHSVREDYYTSNDVTDLTELGIAYGPGSLGALIPEGFDPATSGKSPFDIINPQVPDPMKLAGSDPNAASPFPVTKWVHNISRNQYDGSFVVRLHARGHDGKDVEVGREAILSRWNVKGCSNCQNHPNVDVHVPLDAATLELLKARAGPTGEIDWVVKIQTHDRVHEFPIAASGEDRGGEWPKVDDL
jgi:tyrosinase